MKLDRDRTPLWRQSLLFELGSSRASSVLVDAADNVIISWAGSECSSGNVLRKYDAEGALQWSSCLEVRQGLGGVPIAIDGGEILVAGVAAGAPPANGGAREWLVQRYDAAGERVWSRPLATLITSRDGLDDINDNALSAMVVDGHGNIYVVGRVLGRKPEVSLDVFVTKLDREAHKLWTRIVSGKPRLDDQGVAIALDARDQPYVLARMDHPARESLSTSPARLWLGKLAP